MDIVAAIGESRPDQIDKQGRHNALRVLIESKDQQDQGECLRVQHHSGATT